MSLFWKHKFLCPNEYTTPITAVRYRQCLPLSVVKLKGKHCQKDYCHSGVVDTFGYCMTRPVFIDKNGKKVFLTRLFGIGHGSRQERHSGGVADLTCLKFLMAAC